MYLLLRKLVEVLKRIHIELYEDTVHGQLQHVLLVYFNSLRIQAYTIDVKGGEAC